ncbi:excisionase family DNA binding protein [Demequina lutea]|uniref:Excisionase family DNA binding protein n=1 Tax=Demequina lutea TaxID=431489 RepID=A0A7Z0CIX1_9MICO|nr:excisionase family DNA binding protein [Demequina lutea]
MKRGAKGDSGRRPASIAATGRGTESAGYCSKEFAADYMDMSVKSIERRISDGALPAFRVGNTRTVRIKICDLDAMMVPVQP